MDLGQLKYIGQVRVISQHGRTPGSSGMPGNYRQQGNNPNDYDDAMYIEQDNKECGYGKLIWPDNSTFEGYWINGQAIGIGVFRSTSNDVFEGVWQQDKQTNLCVFRQNNVIEYLNKESHMGTESDSAWMQSDKQNGKGIEVWSDGSYYLGCFEEGQKEGKGIYFWADGSKYTGNWAKDEMSGEGCFEWADGRYFKGEFKNGVMHGSGVYVWQDGRSYEGQYQQNKKHGFGTYTYSDGSKYKGNWVNGMQHGDGCIIDAESTEERSGRWEQGKLREWYDVETTGKTYNPQEQRLDHHNY